jgi:hypothetical protein
VERITDQTWTVNGNRAGTLNLNKIMSNMDSNLDHDFYSNLVSFLKMPKREIFDSVFFPSK